MEQARKPVIDYGAISPIVSGYITIIKSSHQSSVISQLSTLNSQLSTVNSQQLRTVQPELISDLTNFIVVRSRIISNKKPPQMEVF